MRLQYAYGGTGVKCIGSWRTKLYKHLLKIKRSVVSSMRGTLESCIREDRRGLADQVLRFFWGLSSLIYSDLGRVKLL